MLQVLRDHKNSKHIKLSVEFHRDLNWFIKFLDIFNGKSFFKKRKYHHLVDLDACLTGMGAVCNTEIYTVKTPVMYEQANIATLEMLNILVAVKIWGHKWATTSVRIACDNEAVVKVLNSGHTKCPHLATIARNIFMEIASQDIELTVVHIPGKQNEVADLLSRWQGTVDNEKALKKHLKLFKWLKVSESHLKVDSSI